MLMLTSTYQIQQRTHHHCLHQYKLLQRTPHQCLCLLPHTEFNNEHPTIACTNRHSYIEHFANACAYHQIPNTTMYTPQLFALLHRKPHQCLCLPPHTEFNNEHPTIACTKRHSYIEHFAKANAYHHILNTTTNTPQLLAQI